MKTEAASFVVRVHIPTWREFGVGGVVWSQAVIPIKGSPADPSPLVLTEPSFVDGVASVRIAGGSPGARYALTTAPTDGYRTPQWVKGVRIQIV